MLTLSSCSFKSASGAATQQLIERGAFPGQAPVWVSQTGLTQSRYPGFGKTTGTGFNNSLNQNILERQYNARNANLKKVKAAAKLKSKEVSPLDKILEICPRIEEQLNKALVTTELTARIAQYQSLTRRCVISSELWVWLGNDYLASGDYLQAKSCAEKAISLDPRNKEAGELINNASVRKASKK